MTCKFMLDSRQISENRRHWCVEAKKTYGLHSHSIKIIDYIRNSSKANKTLFSFQVQHKGIRIKN